MGPVSQIPSMFISSMWDVKEVTHYARRVGHGVPCAVAVLCKIMYKGLGLGLGVRVRVRVRRMDYQTKNNVKLNENFGPYEVSLHIQIVGLEILKVLL